MNSDLLKRDYTTQHRSGGRQLGSVISPGVQIFIPISCYAASGVASEDVHHTHICGTLSFML